MTHGKYEKYMNSRRNGFGMNLYRNTRAKKIGGVCAGIADHFEIDHNIMRIAFVAAVIFTGPIAFWGYFIGWIVLLPKSLSDREYGKETTEKMDYEYDEGERCYRRKKMFRYRRSTSERLSRAKSRLNKIVSRVDDMEQYVTSNKFNLNRQFADLEK